MSELTATQCGCGRDNCPSNNCGCNSWIWIIIILFFLGGCGNTNDCGFGGMGNLFGGGGSCDNNNCCCEWIIILILLLSCCGNN